MKKSIAILSALCLLLAVFVMPAAATTATEYPTAYPSLGVEKNTPVAAEDGYFTFTSNDALQIWGMIEAASDNVVVDFNASQFPNQGANSGNYLGIVISSSKTDLVDGVVIIMQPFGNTDVFVASAFNLTDNVIGAPIASLQMSAVQNGICFVGQDMSVKYNASTNKLAFACGELVSEMDLDLSALGLGETCYVGIIGSTLDQTGGNQPAIFNARILTVAKNETPEPTETTEPSGTAPKTGDPMVVVLPLALLCLTAVAVLSVSTKKIRSR